MDGYLLIDKPKGWTSFDAVNKIRYWLSETTGQPVKKLKVGHAGTLDPNATGLLIVLTGAYTKRQAEFMKMDKIYLAEVVLGATSSTDDADGEVTEGAIGAKPALGDVENAIGQLVGDIEQTPPQYSAIRLRGKKAYELARAGQTAELKPRSVTIHSISGVEYAWPELKFRTTVSSGTYVRAMARDIGHQLGVGGYLRNLRRESIGPYRLEDALPISQLSPDTIRSHLKQT